jgi:two-component system nitrogen regulation sensor histidine kinase NtrY
MVQGDGTLLRQALINLIKNGVEATGENERIWVTLVAGEDFARIAVEDEGSGWPDAEREVALDPYVTTKEEGTGLGLSLVQRTVLQHGGRLELEDRAEGGARVTLFLPYRSSLKVKDASTPNPEESG